MGFSRRSRENLYIKQMSLLFFVAVPLATGPPRSRRKLATRFVHGGPVANPCPSPFFTEVVVHKNTRTFGPSPFFTEVANINKKSVSVPPFSQRSPPTKMLEHSVRPDFSWRSPFCHLESNQSCDFTRVACYHYTMTELRENGGIRTHEG